MESIIDTPHTNGRYTSSSGDEEDLLMPNRGGDELAPLVTLVLDKVVSRQEYDTRHKDLKESIEKQIDRLDARIESIATEMQDNSNSSKERTISMMTAAIMLVVSILMSSGATYIVTILTAHPGK